MADQGGPCRPRGGLPASPLKWEPLKALSRGGTWPAFCFRGVILATLLRTDCGRREVEAGRPERRSADARPTGDDGHGGAAL